MVKRVSTLALSGSDADTLLVFRKWMVRQGKEPWVIWEASHIDTPPALYECAHKLITFKAHAYVAECLILSTQRCVSYENADHVWIVDTDQCTVKTCPDFAALDASHDEDVVLDSRGCSRFSRKALQTISRDFGSGLDYSSLSSCVLHDGMPVDQIKSPPAP